MTAPEHERAPHGPADDPSSSSRPRSASEPEAQLVVMAKAPIPGRVKTRLCPPCSATEAAALAAAALADTLAAVRATPVARRVLVLDGDPADCGELDLTGLEILPQRGEGLAVRLVNAFADSMAGPHRQRPTLLVGMDTPQLDPVLLGAALGELVRVGAVFGRATDGGWWALGVTDPELPSVLARIPMSRDDTGALTAAALAAKNIRWAELSELTDVDTFDDACAVAAAAPDGRFAAALNLLRTSTGAMTS